MAEVDYEDEEPMPEGLSTLVRREFPRVEPYPDVGALMDEVSFFVTCYWVEGPPEGGVDQSACYRLTNGAVGGELGELWSGSAASKYLIMATQFFAQAWTERRWLERFPVSEVVVPAEWTDGFGAFLVERLNTQMQEEHVKEFSSNCYETLLPIGARGLAMRLNGSRGGAARKLVYLTQSVSVVSEIDEMFDTEASLKLVGYDPAHPLQDAMSCMFVQVACDTESDFSMVLRCTLPTADLIQRGKQLETCPTPLICRLCNQWLVADRGAWHRPSVNTFAAAWMVLLSLLKQHHDFQLDVMTDLSYWEQKLGVTLDL